MVQFTYIHTIKILTPYLIIFSQSIRSRPCELGFASARDRTAHLLFGPVKILTEIESNSNYSIGSWADNCCQKTYTVDTALRSDEYDEDYREEHAIEHQSLAMEERVIHHSSRTEEAKSIDGNCSPIDPHSTLTSEVKQEDDTYYGYLTPDEFGIFRDP